MRRDIEAQGESLVSAATNLLHWQRVNVTPSDEPQAATRLGVTVFVFEEPIVVPARKSRGSSAKSGPSKAKKRGPGPA